MLPLGKTYFFDLVIINDRRIIRLFYFSLIFLLRLIIKIKTDKKENKSCNSNNHFQANIAFYKIYIVIEKDGSVSSRRSAVGNRQSPVGSQQSAVDSSQTKENISSTKPKDLSTDELPTGDCRLTIFLTHGHQGDASSDGNWFSKFFVANVWAPLQSYLRINPNTPAYDEDIKTLHNLIMYEWSAKYKNLVLITGHTHQPVFESLTHPERLYRKLGEALKANDKEEADRVEQEIKRRGRNYKTTPAQFLSVKPSYFNSGCCCFRDGDITGIEITYEKILLVKWSATKGREVLEEMALDKLQDLIK